MKYMIHACVEREWFVRGWLIPSLKEQGIADEEIILYLDTERDGNLKAFLKSLELVKDEPGDTWHLQDDVVVSKRFAEITRRGVFDIHGDPFEGVVCGFCNVEYDKFPHIGIVPIGRIWWSFQCIRIPNKLAAEFLDWMDTDMVKERYPNDLAEGKHDDMFFKDFLCYEHYEDMLYNLMPNLVEHVDYLIGGSVINQQRIKKTTKARYWDEGDVLTLVQRWLEEERK